MKEKGFHLYLGVVNYKVLLDEANRIDKVRIGIETYYRCNYRGEDEINRNVLKRHFSLMMAYSPEKFRKLYELLKQNDPEMFRCAQEVVENMRSFCNALEK